MSTSTRTRRRTTTPEPEDNRDKHPQFDEYTETWLREVEANPCLAALSPSYRRSVARQLARTTVRQGPRVWR